MLERLIEKFVAKRLPYPSRDAIAKEVHEKHLAVGKDIAARYTRGNVRIQMRHMILKEEMGASGTKRARP